MNDDCFASIFLRGQISFWGALEFILANVQKFVDMFYHEAKYLFEAHIQTDLPFLGRLW